MIENALDVLDVALAAAEPGRRSGYFVPSKSRGELVLVTTPDGYVQRYQEFIDLVIDKESSVRAQPSEFVDSQQGMSWFRVDGYAVVGDKRLLELFDGASADLAGAVETWNVAYDPNGGSNKHVLESLTEVFDDVKNKPGVVVAPAILAVKLRATRFNRVIAKHLQEFWRDSVPRRADRERQAAGAEDGKGGRCGLHSRLRHQGESRILHTGVGLQVEL